MYVGVLVYSLRISTFTEGFFKRYQRFKICYSFLLLTFNENRTDRLELAVELVQGEAHGLGQVAGVTRLPS